jgi:hypothetical protein
MAEENVKRREGFGARKREEEGYLRVGIEGEGWRRDVERMKER